MQGRNGISNGTLHDDVVEREKQTATPSFLLKVIQEVRAPLAEIVGFSNVIKRGVAGENRRLAQTIHGNGSRLVETLMSVLDLVQIEHGLYVSEATRIDIVAHAREMLEEYRPKIRERGLWLKFIDPGVPVEAQIDPSALRRILSSLLSNAVNFTTKGGVTIGIRPRNGRGEIVVKDTGCGISRAFLPRAFDAFTREDIDDGGIRQGSGLGLTIARRLIHELKGEIEIISTRGQGTTCIVSLPARCRHLDVDIPDYSDDAEEEVEEVTVQARARVSTSSTSGRARSMPEELLAPTKPVAPKATEIGERFVSPDHPNVLLVEDNLITRRVMEMMLAPIYNVVSVAGVDQALSSAANRKFDLLLLDISLNERRTGVEVLHAIRKMEGYEGVPAIACTAYSLPGIRERYLETGFTGYIAKPFRKEQLLELIETVMLAGVQIPVDNSMKEKVEVDLPPMPHTLTHMLDLMGDEHADERAGELNRILAGDPVASSWVLRHANSAFYSVRGNVNSVDRAVTLIGLEPVCNLVVAQVMSQTFATMEMERCRHVFDYILQGAVAAAAFARDLAAEVGLENPEIAFTAGLIHDVGRLSLLSNENEKYADMWYEDGERFAAPTIGRELMQFSIDHQLMGIELSKEWDLPVEIDQAIRHFQDPEDAAADYRRIVYTVAAGRAAAQIHILRDENVDEFEPLESRLDAALKGLVAGKTDQLPQLRSLIESKVDDVRALVQSLSHS